MQDIYDITLKIKRYDPEARRTWVQDYNLKAGRIIRFNRSLSEEFKQRA